MSRSYRASFSFVVQLFLAGFAGALFGLCAAMLVSGCTPAQTSAISSGTQAAITATKIAACVQGVMAEEQLELLRQRREQEAADAMEADRLRSDMRVPSSISREVDKVVRGDAGLM